MARPDGPGCRPSDQTPSGSGGNAASIPRAETRTPYRPESGRYTDWHGRGCLVLISREPKMGEDGSVTVTFDDGSWTSAFFQTFKRWGYRRASDERAQREDAERLSPKDASAVGREAEAPIPTQEP